MYLHLARYFFFMRMKTLGQPQINTTIKIDKIKILPLEVNTTQRRMIKVIGTYRWIKWALSTQTMTWFAYL